MLKFILLSIGPTIQMGAWELFLGVEDGEDEVVLVKISCAPAFIPSPTVLVRTVLTWIFLYAQMQKPALLSIIQLTKEKIKTRKENVPFGRRWVQPNEEKGEKDGTFKCNLLPESWSFENKSASFREVK